MQRKKDSYNSRGTSSYRNRFESKTKTSFRGLFIGIALVVVLAIIFLITSGGPVYRGSVAEQADIADNVKAIALLEEKTPVNFKENRPGRIVDMEAEQEKILAMRGKDYDLEQIQRWYKGTAIIGDSITLRTAVYGFLDYDVVCGKVAGALYNCDDVVEAGIALHPYVVFLCFGANDTTGYVSNTEAFAEDYGKLVNRIKEALPDAVIYINCILPPQPGNSYVDPSFQYRDDLNEALKNYCEETDDVYFIDSSFILDNNTDLYDFDGIHPLGEFFPMWLTYMADVAGLSEEEESAEEESAEDETSDDADETVEEAETEN